MKILAVTRRPENDDHGAISMSVHTMLLFKTWMLSFELMKYFFNFAIESCFQFQGNPISLVVTCGMFRLFIGSLSETHFFTCNEADHYS